MTALPSGWVLISRLPSSLPSFTGWRTTWAPSIGFLLKPLITMTSMCDVSGGALYLRPCSSGFGLSSSWARTCIGTTQANTASNTIRPRTKVRRGCLRSGIRSFYATPARPWIKVSKSQILLVRGIRRLTSVSYPHHCPREGKSLDTRSTIKEWGNAVGDCSSRSGSVGKVYSQANLTWDACCLFALLYDFVGGGGWVHTPWNDSDSVLDQHE